MKDFTFYSKRDIVFTRIDMMWASAKLLVKTKKMEIILKIKSDHNPLIWTGQAEVKCFRWRLNENSSQRRIHCANQRKVKEFFQVNQKKDSKIQTIWEAYKETIRGNLIALNSFQEKKKKQKVEELQRELQIKENELKKNPKKKMIFKEINSLRHQINNTKKPIGILKRFSKELLNLLISLGAVKRITNVNGQVDRIL